jgi:hypothetical protein
MPGSFIVRLSVGRCCNIWSRGLQSAGWRYYYTTLDWSTTATILSVFDIHGVLPQKNRVRMARWWHPLSPLAANYSLTEPGVSTVSWLMIPALHTASRLGYQQVDRCVAGSGYSHAKLSYMFVMDRPLLGITIFF